MNGFWRDFRSAVRRLWRRPGFSIAAISILAAGMGGTVALWSVVKGALLDPWPYEGYRRIVTVAARYPRMAQDRLGTWSVPEVLDLEAQSQIFDGVVEGVARNVNLTGGAEPERLHAVAMNAGAFATLGVSPLLGRAFSSAEDRPGAAKVVVLSDRFWRQRFGAEAGVVGRPLSIEGTPYTIVGVMPPRFLWWDAALYFPLALDRSDLRRTVRQTYFQARLRPGLSLASAEAALDSLMRRWERDAGAAAPEYHGARFRLALLIDQVLRDVRPVLWILLSSVALVFLVAAANVANLLLARAAKREREIAIRRAIGADFSRVASLFFAEALVISLSAGAIAFAAARIAVVAILSAIPRGFIPAEADIRVGGSALFLAALLAFGSAALLGIAPALRTFSDSGLSNRLTAAPAGRLRRRRIFVIAQVAAAVAFVSTAGLLLQSFRRLASTPAGVRTDGTLTLRIALPRDSSPRRGESAALFDEILRKMEAVPGIASAGAVSSLPLQDAPEAKLALEGSGSERNGTVFEADSLVTAGRYFRAAGISLRKGRLLDSRDAADAPAVALINETMAERFWPGRDPVGTRLRFEGREGSPWRTIVGVVADVRQTSLEAPVRPQVYVPASQAEEPARSLAIAVETSSPPDAIVPLLREAVRAARPDLPLFAVQPMADLLRDSLGGRRLAVLLMEVFGLGVLVLSIAGVYGIVSFSVSRRVREIGIRMALGSSPRSVVSLLLRESAAALAGGAVVGAALAAAAARLLSAQLTGISSPAPIAIGSALLLLLLTTIATLVPARRAARIDPMEALRNE